MSAATDRERPHLADANEYFKEGTLVIFDLDNTVIESTTALGGDQWFSRLLEINIASGMSSSDAKSAAVARWQRVQPLVQTRTVEADTAAQIAALQHRGIKVIGLTARPEAVRKDTLRQLASVGVSFDNGADELCFVMEVRSCFDDGILYVNNSDKGLALLRLADELQWTLNDVVMIDDKLHNVEAVDKALNEFNAAHPDRAIHHVEFRYGAADATVAAYDHALAQTQELLLNSILSDEDTRIVRDALGL